MSKPRSKRNWCANGTEFLFHKMHSQLKLLLGKQAASGLIALCTRIFGLQPHVQDRKTAAEDYPRAFKLAVTVTIKFLYGLRCLSLEQSCLSWGMRETNTSLAHSFPMFPYVSLLFKAANYSLQMFAGSYPKSPRFDRTLLHFSAISMIKLH